MDIMGVLYLVLLIVFVVALAYALFADAKARRQAASPRTRIFVYDPHMVDANNDALAEIGEHAILLPAIGIGDVRFIEL